MTRRSAQRTEEAEAALRESEERLRLVANNVPALISVRRPRAALPLQQPHLRRLVRHRARARCRAAPSPRCSATRPTAACAQNLERVPRRRGGRVRVRDGRRRRAARTLQVACVPHLAAPERRGARLLHAGERRHRAQARAGGPALRRDPAAARRAAPGVPRPPRHADRPAQPRHVRRARARGGGARPAARQERGVALHRPRQLQGGQRQPRPRRRRRAAEGHLRAPARLRCAATTSSRASAATSSACCCRTSPIRARRRRWRRSWCTSCGKPYRIGEHQLSSGASIGIACVPQDGDDVATLLRLADAAMYRAKELGRNGYQFFSAMLNEDARRGGGAGRRAARRHRARRAVPRLPAAHRHRHAPGGRRRGAAALAPSALRRARAGSLPAARRRQRPAGADRRLGAARGLRAGPALDRRGHHAAHAWWSTSPRASCATARSPSRCARRSTRAACRRIAADRGARKRWCARCPSRSRPRSPRSPPAARAWASTTSAPATPRCRCCSACARAPSASTASWSPACRRTPSAPASRARSSPLRAASNFEVVAKGVETHAQREFLAEAGCRVCQGDLFATPNSPDIVAPMLRARLAA